MKTLNIYNERVIVGRLLFSFYFITLLFRFFQQVTPSQMLQPVLYRYNFDYTYWLFDIIGVYRYVVQSATGSMLFDMALFTSCMLCIIYPLKNLWAILFGILFFVYVICYNAFIVHHAHPLALMTLATLPFFFKQLVLWRFLWEGFRYYVCYAYFISFIWKAFIGKSLLYWNMGIHSTKENLVMYLYHYPETLLADIYRFFIAHPILLNLGLIIVFVLEGLMIIGFITKRFDYLLIWIPIIVHVSTYFFSDVYFAEMLVGILAFLHSSHYIQIANKFPLLKLT